MSVRFVVTEHPPALTSERMRHYARIRTRLERAAGAEVDMGLYTELGGLGGVDAIVLSGSFAPWAAHDPSALERLGETVRAYRGPVLGICAGMQLQARFTGGSLGKAVELPHTGFNDVEVLDSSDLFDGLPTRVTVYRHHTDEVKELPPGFRILARSADCAVEAIADARRRWWGTQFHPEEFDREHPHGERVLRNFFELAGVAHPPGTS